jgi:hypothetical protein
MRADNSTPLDSAVLVQQGPIFSLSDGVITINYMEQKSFLFFSCFSQPMKQSTENFCNRIPKLG